MAVLDHASISMNACDIDFVYVLTVTAASPPTSSSGHDIESSSLYSDAVTPRFVSFTLPIFFNKIDIESFSSATNRLGMFEGETIMVMSTLGGEKRENILSRHMIEGAKQQQQQSLKQSMILVSSSL